MIKFSHSLFALPMAGIAFVQAWRLGTQDGSIFQDKPFFLYFLAIKVCLCMIFLRSVAMAFNRLVDRHYDLKNPRTANRELPAKKLSVRQVSFFIVLSAILFLFFASSINSLATILALPALFLVFSYSYMKRFSSLCHFFLGAVIGLAPTATWVAVLGRIELLPILWTIALLFYIAGFDILYACQDYEFDKKERLHSLPVSLGIQKALYISRFSHILALACFILAGLFSDSGFIFYIGVFLVCILFFIEHFLVRPSKEETLKNIPIAFFHINASISMILFLSVFLDKTNWILFL